MKKILTLVSAVLATVSLMATQTTVAPGSASLSAAIGKAAAGDTLVLTTGEYAESAEIPVSVALTFIAAEDAKPVLKLSSGGKNFNFSAPFEMNGLEILSATNGYVVRAASAAASAMVFKNCYFHGGGGPLIYGSNYEIGKVEIDNCIFDNCTRGEGAVFQSTGGPVGEFIFTNSTVSNMSGSYAVMAQKVNKALVDHCTFYNAGTDPIYIGVSGVNDTCIVKNSIIDSISAGTATTTYKGTVSYCMYNRAAAPFENEGAVVVANCQAADPLFVDAAKGDFCLAEGSLAIGAAEDGTNLGDPRWVAKPKPLVEITETFSADLEAAEAVVDSLVSSIEVKDGVLTMTISSTTWNPNGVVIPFGGYVKGSNLSAIKGSFKCAPITANTEIYPYVIDSEGYRWYEKHFVAGSCTDWTTFNHSNFKTMFDEQEKADFVNRDIVAFGFVASSGTPLDKYVIDLKEVEIVVGAQTGLMKVAAEKKVNKMMVDGQMVIIRDGVMYNVLGTAL